MDGLQSTVRSAISTNIRTIVAITLRPPRFESNVCPLNYRAVRSMFALPVSQSGALLAAGTRVQFPEVHFSATYCKAVYYSICSGTLARSG